MTSAGRADGQSAPGRGLAPVALAYAGVVVIGCWILATVDRAAWTGLVWLALLLFLPALAMTLWLVDRLRVRAPASRAAVGAAATAGWPLLVAGWFMTVGEVVGRAELLGPAYLLAAGGGAVLGLMSPRVMSRRSGQILTAAAAVVAMILAVVAVLMAGRWGVAT